MRRSTEGSFARALLDPHAPLPSGISGDEAERRFSVYRNNVVVGLTDALQAAYPVTCRLLGETFFRAAAAEFARTRPPASPVLLTYGKGFADFLRQFPPAARVPYAADVAMVDRAVLEAFHAEDADAAEPSGIFATAADPGRLALLLHPSLHILSSGFAAGSVWLSSREEPPMPLGVPLERSEDVLIARPRLHVEVRVVPPGTTGFVRALRQKASIEDAAAEGTRYPGFDLTTALTALLSMGGVTGTGRAMEKSIGPEGEDSPIDPVFEETT